MSSISSYSNEQCINEVCSSTASLSVSSNPNREYDSPTVVSNSSSTAHSDQFEDAPEDYVPSPSPKVPVSMNPLDALAMACAAEKDHQGQPIQHPGQQPRLPTNVSSNSNKEGSPTASFQISQNDVLCGRGGLTNHHPGNVFFRRLVRIKQESYLRATKREKAGVAREIVDIIRNLSPSGRFLKKDTRNPGVWIEIGDRKAREKTSQALREGAPELREELQSEGTPNTPEEVQRSQPVFIPENGRTLLDTMKEHQAHSWSQFTTTKETPQKPLTVSSNRVRVVSDDSNAFAIQRPSIPSHRAVSLPTQHHIIMDDRAQPVVSPHALYLTQTPTYRHPQPFDAEEDSESSRHSASGSKRKSMDLAQSSNGGVNRGPRLKLLKQRLQSGGED